MSTSCLEIVKWKSKEGIPDESIIGAVNNMVADLKQCPGFIQQALYKINETWVDVYYWKDVHSAHASNGLMTGKDSLNTLMNIIDANSVSIEVSEPVQASGDLNIRFNEC